MSNSSRIALGSLAEVQTGPFGAQLHAADYVDEGTPIITVEHLLTDGRLRYDRVPRVSPNDARRLNRYSLREGDLVFSRVGAIDRCSYISSTEDGWLFSGRLLRVRPDPSRADSKFLASLLSHDHARRWIRGHAVGSTMSCLNTSILKGVPIHLPPLREQQSIAAILGAVDEAIRSTERLIAKLEQAKQGLLQDLLTRGIDEDGHLRDTNHPDGPAETNIGRFPASRRVVPLGEMSEIVGGVALGRSISGAATVELPYLRVANVQDGFIDTSEIKTTRVLRAEVTRYRLCAGDVLMTEGGDFDKLGRSAMWEGSIDPCLHQNHIFRVRCNRSALIPEFLALYSASPSGRRYFVVSSKQTTNLASINMTQLKAFPIPTPAIQEQLRIVKTVEAQTVELCTEQATLRKLRLVKQGLMDDLLTGRVRVAAEEAISA